MRKWLKSLFEKSDWEWQAKYWREVAQKHQDVAKQYEDAADYYKAECARILEMVPDEVREKLIHEHETETFH